MPRQNPAAEVKWTFLDYLGRSSTVGINMPTNLGIIGMAGELADAATLREAMLDLVSGTLVRQEFSPYVTKYNSSLTTTNTNIQRERRWIVIYQDDVNFERMQLTVPCARVANPANDTILDTEGFAILTSVQWTAFIIAFELVARSKDGNTVTILYAYIQDDNL